MLTWSTACPDWEERIIAGRSLMPCPPLFPDEAEAGLAVFRRLPIVDMIGKPTFGEVARPWAFDLPAAVFGSYNQHTGRREINKFFELIAKKNTKSTRAAGIMLTELVRNERHSAEYTIIAPTIEVAKNSSEPAMDFVAEHPTLKRILKPISHQRLIEHRHTGAQLKILAADSETVAGGKSTGVLFDELWLFGKRAKARNMMREAMGGLKSRPEGFVIALTTQADDPPEGVFLDWLRRYRDIRDGKLIAPRSMGFLYEFPEAMVKSEAYKDRKNWHIPNPNLGASVDEQSLIDDFEEARREGQKSLVGFYAKSLNIEPGMGGRSDGWAGAEHWKKAASKKIDLNYIIEHSEVIIIGIDGGGQDDLYGLTVLGREANEMEVRASDAPEELQEPVAGKKLIKRWLSWSHAWAHQSVLDRRKSIVEKLNDLEAAGEITILEDGEWDESGWPAEAAQIIAIVKKVMDAGLLCCVACDAYRVGELIDALDSIGVVQDNTPTGRNYLTGVQQGVALGSSAGTTVERKLANGTLLHADQALMDWCVANVKVERLPTGFRFTKQNPGDAKIDPAMALFNAAMIMATNPDACRSIYETQGLRFI